MMNSIKRRAVLGVAGVLAIVFVLCGGMRPAHAQNLYNAGIYAKTANEYGNYSAGQGMTAYLYQDLDAFYSFWLYADYAKAYAGAAYVSAEAGYYAIATEAAYWSYIYTLYDYIYKYYAAADAWAAYAAEDYAGIVAVMENYILTGDIINAGAIFYSALASVGGAY